jgi:UDP-glucose 4-epimerase
MTILVTGALGVNGAWVTRKLIDRGITPLVMDVRADTTLLGPDYDKRFEFVGTDFTDTAAVADLLQQRRVDCIIHMAAIVGAAAQDPYETFRVNAHGTNGLLEAARRNGVRRFVFTSSRAFYGGLEEPYTHPTYRPIREDGPSRPFQVYDVCKVASEGMGRNFAARYGLEFVALRFATIFGPGKTLRHGNYGVLSRLIEEPLNGRPVRIPQGGDQQDDMIYVDDIAEAIVVAAQHPAPRFTEYNISRGVGATLHDLAAAVRRVVPDADIEIGPGLDFLGLGATYAGVLDNSRAAQDLGFRPRFDLTAAVEDYARQMRRLGLLQA